MKYIPIVIAMIILGAHFLRDGQTVLALLIGASPLILLIRKNWSLLFMQGFAYFGTLIWLHAAITLTQQRIAFGAPWMRMLVILLVVAAFTLFAGLLLHSISRQKRTVISSGK